MFKRCTSLVVAFTLAGFAVGQPYIMVDTMSGGTWQTEIRGNDLVSHLETGLNVTQTIGGARFTSVDVRENVFLQRVAFVVGTGYASVSHEGPFRLPISLGFGYGSAVGGNPLNLDLRAYVSGRLFEITAGPWQAEHEIAVWDGNGNFAISTSEYLSSGRIYFDRNTFVGSIDWSDIDSIMYKFHNERMLPGGFAVDEIRIVPEPGTMAGLGVLYLLALRRRRYTHPV
jgi:hypothetical protein